MISANNILMPFECFVDTDLGLMNLVKTVYNNPKMIYDTIFKEQEFFLLYLLANREEENPLSIILQEEYKASMDSLREQFIDQEYDKILELSKTNTIFSLIELLYESGAVDIDILCSDETQHKYAIELFKDKRMNIFISQNLSKIDISKYDTIFVKIYEDVLKYKGLNKKNIYVLNYKFNTELDPNKKIRPKVIVEGLISDKNSTSIISPYDLSEITIVG